MKAICDKSALRAHYLQHRLAVTAEEAAAAADAVSQRVVERVAQMQPQIVGAYVAMRGELSLDNTMKRLHEKGVVVALPAVIAPNQPLSFHRWQPSMALQSGRYGTQQPETGGEALTPDLLLVPLLAFDSRGHRLGYGGGYYDRTLETLHTHPGFKGAYGIAYECQLADALPAEPHDHTLNGVITSHNFLEFH